VIIPSCKFSLGESRA